MTSSVVLDCKNHIAVANLLIADDDEAFRECMSELLVCSGYHCETAADGTEALDRVLRGDIDLVLADVCMPGNHNLELVRALNGLGVPVVLMTAYPDLDKAITGGQLSAAGQVAKPVHFGELVEKVAAALADLPERG